MHVTLPLFITTFSLYILAPIITQTSLRASLLQWLENGQQPSSFSFPTNLVGAALGFGAAASIQSASLYAGDGGPRAVLFNSFRGVVDGAVGEDTHLLVPWPRNPCISTVSAPPSKPPPLPSPLRRRWWRSRLRELPRWREKPRAVMELAWVTGLGLPMMDLGLELEPNPSLLMEGSMFPHINGL